MFSAIKFTLATRVWSQAVFAMVIFTGQSGWESTDTRPPRQGGPPRKSFCVRAWECRKINQVPIVTEPAIRTATINISRDSFIIFRFNGRWPKRLPRKVRVDEAARVIQPWPHQA